MKGIKEVRVLQVVSADYLRLRESVTPLEDLKWFFEAVSSDLERRWLVPSPSSSIYCEALEVKMSIVSDRRDSPGVAITLKGSEGWKRDPKMALRERAIEEYRSVESSARESLLRERGVL